MSANDTLFSRYPNEYWIESGSYYGAGICAAIACGFKHVYSIELSDQFYSAAVEKFADNPDVKIFHGDSGKILYDVIKDIREPITFWLDGHYSGGETARGDKESPLIEEVLAIGNHAIKTHTVLIDDVRCYPDLMPRVKEILLSINPAYEFSYEDGCEKNDILVAQIRKGT